MWIESNGKTRKNHKRFEKKITENSEDRKFAEKKIQKKKEICKRASQKKLEKFPNIKIQVEKSKGNLKTWSESLGGLKKLKTEKVWKQIKITAFKVLESSIKKYVIKREEWEKFKANKIKNTRKTQQKKNLNSKC